MLRLQYHFIENYNYIGFTYINRYILYYLINIYDIDYYCYYSNTV